MPRSNAPETQNLFPPKSQESALELKGSIFTLPVLVLRSFNLSAIETQLAERVAKGALFFENAPVVIDLEAMRENEAPLDFVNFVNLLRKCHLVPVGIQHGSPAQGEAAVAAGLALLRSSAVKELPTAAQRKKKAAARQGEPESPHPQGPETTTPPPAPAAASSTTTVIHQPVRSGQRIVGRSGDLIVLAAVNAGAEIIAEGNIHVYGPLRGRALAGMSGNAQARIFCRHMEAELVAIAGQYRVFENKIPAELLGKAAQVYLEGDQLIVAPLD